MVAAEHIANEPRMNVLVVEGNPAEREQISSALAPHFTLIFVSGFSEALAAVQSGRADVVVTELDLADGDGLGLCEQLRALPQAAQLPIMVLTHRANIQDKVAGFEAGADDYVVKPLDARLFYARVRLLCRIKGLERPNSTW
jgi:DNA-binding response OmpR family regulator